MVASNTCPITAEQAQRLLDSIDRMTRAQKMSDAALSDAVIHIACCLSNTEHYEVLSEILVRFDKKAGIVRDADAGEIIS